MNSLWTLFVLIFCLANNGSLAQSGIKGRSFEQHQPRTLSPAAYSRQQYQKYGQRLNKPAVANPENYMNYHVGPIEPRPILVPHGQQLPHSQLYQQQPSQVDGSNYQVQPTPVEVQGRNLAQPKDQQEQQQQQRGQNQTQIADWSRYMQKYPGTMNDLAYKVSNDSMIPVAPRPSGFEQVPIIQQQQYGPGPVAHYPSYMGATPIMYHNVGGVPQQQFVTPQIATVPIGHQAGYPVLKVPVGQSVRYPISNMTSTDSGYRNGRLNYYEVPRQSDGQPQVNRLNFYNVKDGFSGRGSQIPQQNITSVAPTPIQSHSGPVQHFEIPKQIVAGGYPQPNVTTVVHPGGPVQNYQIPRQQIVSPQPQFVQHRPGPEVHIRNYEIPRHPAYLRQPVAPHHQVRPVVTNMQRYEIPTQYLHGPTVMYPSGGHPNGPISTPVMTYQTERADVVGTPIVKAGLIDSIRFPIRGQYVKPHISNDQKSLYRYNAVRQFNPPQPQPNPNYLVSHARPIVTQQQIQTPVYLNSNQAPHSDYKYTLTQTPQQQPQPNQYRQGPMPVSSGQMYPPLPQIQNRNDFHPQQSQPQQQPNNQYYRLPVQTIRTVSTVNPVRNFYIPPYMHPYQFPGSQMSPAVTSVGTQAFDQHQQPVPQPMYYNIGESEDQQSSGGRPITTVTIEELPKNNDGKNEKPDGQSQPEGVVRFTTVGHPLVQPNQFNVNDSDDRRYGQPSSVEYDENSSETETPEGRPLSPSSGNNPSSLDSGRHGGNNNDGNTAAGGWVSQEPQKQFFSDEEIRGVALNSPSQQPQQQQKS